jgi:hypothetical protein
MVVQVLQLALYKMNILVEDVFLLIMSIFRQALCQIAQLLKKVYHHNIFSVYRVP